MSEPLQLTAIVYCERPQLNGKNFLKYRNITNQPAPLARFEKFAAKFPGAIYINYYDKHTRNFHRRQWIAEPEIKK